VGLARNTICGPKGGEELRKQVKKKHFLFAISRQIGVPRGKKKRARLARREVKKGPKTIKDNLWEGKPEDIETAWNFLQLSSKPGKQRNCWKKKKKVGDTRTLIHVKKCGKRKKISRWEIKCAA